ncbi:hypothetical protein OJF2_23380 [Aquisphaera giovannonii]|uniref:MetA-pathway of phenol degradation n=1 Tax=Aquisphaera giovannonii TaxID=406548 RepID=A0A5B9VZS1_9BACT|nr:hypothetical protein [Aquisphaera giovannonii]QEH33808.1 hypothetical protein OJF2_23380 [Aquisphaera giovannonii]
MGRNSIVVGRLTFVAMGALAGADLRGQEATPAAASSQASPVIGLTTEPVQPTGQAPAVPQARLRQVPIGQLRNPFETEPLSKRGLIGWMNERPSPQALPSQPGMPPTSSTPGGEAGPGLYAVGTPEGGGAPGTPAAGGAAGGPTGTGPAPGSAAEAFAAAAATPGPGFGGGAEAASTTFPMFGDRGPLFSAATLRFPNIPTPLPPGVPGQGNAGFLAGRSVAAIVPAVRAFKVADNQYPRPVDRVWVNFNYFDGVNSGLNRILQAPIKNMQVYNEIFGIEKTFLDQQASIGFRIPVNTLTIQSGLQNLGGSHTSVGNFSSYLKYAFYADEKGNLLSAGLDMTFPTGPRSFGGYPSLQGINAFELQPFLGYILMMDRAYLQGFTSIQVPTDRNLATMYYFDVSVGYFLYRARDPRAMISAIVPAFETHLNQPLNWAGFQPQYVGSTPTVVDLTFGLNIGLANRAVLSTAYIRPVTGPTPFNGEFALMLNIPFGARGRGLPVTPPVF